MPIICVRRRVFATPGGFRWRHLKWPGKIYCTPIIYRSSGRLSTREKTCGLRQKVMSKDPTQTQDVVKTLHWNEHVCVGAWLGNPCNSEIFISGDASIVCWAHIITVPLSFRLISSFYILLYNRRFSSIQFNKLTIGGVVFNLIATHSRHPLGIYKTYFAYIESSRLDVFF